MKMLPRVLALTLALLVSLGAAGYAIYADAAAKKAESLVTVGIAGAPDDRLIDVCVNAINSYDSLNFAIKAVKLTEDGAKDLLVKGMISGYIVVPENYARDMYYGRDTSLKFVTDSSSTSLGMTLVGEIVDNTAKAGLETTNAIYGAQNYVKDRFTQMKPSDAGDRLFEKLAALMLTRHDTYEVKTLGILGHFSLITYMLCGIMIEYLLFWGVSCSPLFHKNGELSRMLASKKLGAARQIAGEAGAYIILMALCTLPVFGIAKAASALFHADLGEFAVLLSGRFVAQYFLCAVMICLMQQFLYELSNDGVSAPVLQFLVAIVQGYICGCFYPISFFPEQVRAFTAHLPVGAAVRLLGETTTQSVVETVLYAALFFGFSVYLRHRLITREETQS
jgi:hypothetical protein